MTALLLALAAHHGEADPDLLRWIKELLDHLIGLGPWAVVAIIGFLILVVPVGSTALYLFQRRRGSPIYPNPTATKPAAPNPEIGEDRPD